MVVRISVVFRTSLQQWVLVFIILVTIVVNYFFLHITTLFPYNFLSVLARLTRKKRTDRSAPGTCFLFPRGLASRGGARGNNNTSTTNFDISNVAELFSVRTKMLTGDRSYITASVVYTVKALRIGFFFVGEWGA